MSRTVAITVLFPLMIATLLLAVPLATLITVEARSSVREDLEIEAEAAAARFQRLAAREVAPEEMVFAQGAAERIEIWDTTTMRIVASTGPSLGVDSRPRPADHVDQVVVREDRDDVHIVWVRAADGRHIATALVSLETNTQTFIRLGVLVLGLVGTAGAALLSARSLTSRILKPITQLDQTAQALGRGQHNARASLTSGPVELRRLADTLNSSLDRVENTLTGQRRFVANAAHELRTPLTAVRLRVETLDIRHPELGLEPTLQEIDRLNQLISEMLLLSKADAGTMTAVTIDVTEEVRARLSDWHDGLAAQDITVVAELPEHPLMATGTLGVVGHAMDNFLANAARVTTADGVIHVILVPGDGTVEVHVADRGPGLSESHAELAFARFWRAPDAPRDGGTGLGLAIVRGMARLHGGDAVLIPRDGGGTVAILRLTSVYHGDLALPGCSSVSMKTSRPARSPPPSTAR